MGGREGEDKGSEKASGAGEEGRKGRRVEGRGKGGLASVGGGRGVEPGSAERKRED